MNSKKSVLPWFLVSMLAFTATGCSYGPAKLVPDATGQALLAYASAPADNPLKGFLPYSGSYENPHSMEWFYVPLNELMGGPDSYTFDTGLEPKLADVASRGHQAVFRVFLDYPAKPSGIPGFLLKNGLKTYEYSDYGGGKSPDYNDPNLVSTLEKFIDEFGKRYDGDPRIGFITIGLLGFWGEWHTFPHSEWMASENTQNKVLYAFANAFKTTRLLARYPAADSSALNIGYHDDSFAFETLNTDSWRFMGRLEGAGLQDAWQTRPIGGELRPEVQSTIWDDPPDSGAEDYDACIAQTHASWLLNQAFFTDSSFTGEKLDRAVEGAKKLGYELQVTAVELRGADRNGKFDVSVKMMNKGAAPFYYDWKVRLAAADPAGKLVKTWDTDWKITTVIPGEADKQFSFTGDSTDLKKGKYKLLMQVVNPLSNGKELRFANKKQNADVDGWLTLIGFQVR